jgi:hypothetical protein
MEQRDHALPTALKDGTASSTDARGISVELLLVEPRSWRRRCLGMVFEVLLPVLFSIYSGWSGKTSLGVDFRKNLSDGVVNCCLEVCHSTGWVLFTPVQTWSTRYTAYTFPSMTSWHQLFMPSSLERVKPPTPDSSQRVELTEWCLHCLGLQGPGTKHLQLMQEV